MTEPDGEQPETEFENELDDQEATNQSLSKTRQPVYSLVHLLKCATAHHAHRESPH